MTSTTAAVAAGCIIGIGAGIAGTAAVTASQTTSVVSASQTAPPQQGKKPEADARQRMLMRKVMPLLKELRQADTDEEKLVIADELIAAMKHKPKTDTKPPKHGGVLTDEQKQQMKTALDDTKKAFDTFRSMKEQYGSDPSTYTEEQKADIIEAIADIKEAVAAVKKLANEFGVVIPKLPPVPQIPANW